MRVYANGLHFLSLFQLLDANAEQLDSLRELLDELSERRDLLGLCGNACVCSAHRFIWYARRLNIEPTLQLQAQY